MQYVLRTQLHHQHQEKQQAVCVAFKSKDTAVRPLLCKS